VNIIYVLIPLGLVLLAAAVGAFFWAVRSGQFDDLDTPGTLVLFDDEPVTPRPMNPTALEKRP
jgi:cbb3-type cytochrome oxidase maturation protein